MTKPKKQAITEKIIRKILAKWRPRLGLGSKWEVRIRLYETDEHWPYDEAVACADVEPGYFKGLISLNRMSAEKDTDSLEHIILHELCHFITWPLRRIAIGALGDKQEETAVDLDEAIVETFSRALLGKK